MRVMRSCIPSLKEKLSVKGRVEDPSIIGRTWGMRLVAWNDHMDRFIHELNGA